MCTFSMILIKLANSWCLAISKSQYFTTLFAICRTSVEKKFRAVLTSLEEKSVRDNYTMPVTSSLIHREVLKYLTRSQGLSHWGGFLKEILKMHENFWFWWETCRNNSWFCLISAVEIHQHVTDDDEWSSVKTRKNSFLNKMTCINKINFNVHSLFNFIHDLSTRKIS